MQMCQNAKQSQAGCMRKGTRFDQKTTESVGSRLILLNATHQQVPPPSPGIFFNESMFQSDSSSLVDELLSDLRSDSGIRKKRQPLVVYAQQQEAARGACSRL
jgi:hypothetical protein